MRRPGAWLRRIASRICDPDAMARVVDPIVADLSLELAAAQGVLQRSWVRCRACFGFWRALTLCAWHRTWHGPGDGSEVVSPRRIALAGTLTTIAVIGCLVVFAFTNHVSQVIKGPNWSRPVYESWLLATPGELFRAFTYLIPQAVPIALTGVAPIARAISSAGGIAFDELDSDYMIRPLPGVFAAGEMLDWEAPTGGYLLQASFATGVAAGRGALKWLNS